MRRISLLVALLSATSALAAASKKPTTEACDKNRAICTMEFNPAECNLTNGNGKTRTAYGSNRCQAADALRYQLCLEKKTADPNQMQCRPVKK